MSEYGITDSGVNIKRFDTILAEINADQSEGLGVPGGLQHPVLPERAEHQHGG